jgi:hypothetical protein
MVSPIRLRIVAALEAVLFVESITGTHFRAALAA